MWPSHYQRQSISERACFDKDDALRPSFVSGNLEVMTTQSSTTHQLNPHIQYSRRLSLRRAALDHEQRRSRKLWLWRRVVFAIIALTIILAIEKIVAWWLIALPVTVFIALMAIHQRIQASVAR